MPKNPLASPFNMTCFRWFEDPTEIGFWPWGRSKHFSHLHLQLPALQWRPAKKTSKLGELQTKLVCHIQPDQVWQSFQAIKSPKSLWPRPCQAFRLFDCSGTVRQNKWDPFWKWRVGWNFWNPWSGGVVCLDGLFPSKITLWISWMSN